MRKAVKLATLSEGFTARGITINSKSDWITEQAWKFYLHKPYTEDWGSDRGSKKDKRSSSF